MPSNKSSKQDQVRTELLTQGAMSADELVRKLGVSQPTLSRVLKDMPDVLRIGERRGALYAIHREVRDAGSSWPLYQVSLNGKGMFMGTLHAIGGGGYYMQWKASESVPAALRLGEFSRGIFPGLPWFLDDLRPQGFLGRAYAKAHSTRLKISSNPEHWSDDEALVAILDSSHDAPGAYILGQQAFRKFQDRAYEPLPEHTLPEALDPIAEHLLEEGEVAGSSAGGEQPKFATTIETDTGLINVLVKFSGVTKDSTSKRWADLLKAEEHASRVLEEAGFPIATSQVMESERTYLIVSRFDRAGKQGRKPCVSLRVFCAAHTGDIDKPWHEAAEDLHRLKYLSREDADTLSLYHWFGNLIGNIDMHYGNISLFVEDGGLRLCPCYDMLPMKYAATRIGHMSEEPINPRLPLPEYEGNWEQAAKLAQSYWQGISKDRNFSQNFRKIAKANHFVVKELLESVKKVETNEQTPKTRNFKPTQDGQRGRKA